ncbi:MAG: restriction endonuclease subunit S [Oscillospiraceae bacterium]
MHYEKFADGSVKCIEDEIPFELPQGWEWTRLGVIFSHNTGKALNSKSQVGNPYTYITTSNLYWNRFELTDLKQMLFTDAELEKCTVKKGDLLVCEGGDIGRSAIWENDDEIRIQNHIHKMRPYIKLNIKFYYYVLYLYKHTERINGKGIGIQGLSSNQLHSLLFPLPPINEQNIIANKINGYFEYIDFLEKEKSNLSSAIQATKSKILDFAIRGKLVPQDPNDEPASVLLERIRAEKEELIKQGKIKRDKRESVIFKGEDNSYYLTTSDNKSYEEQFLFDLPLGWAWCSLNDIAKIDLGKTLDKAKNTGDYYQYLRSVNVRWGNSDLSDLNEMRFEENELERYRVQKYDLLICEGGDVGRSCVWTSNNTIYYQNALHRVRFYKECNPFFFMYYMMYYESKGIIKSLCKGVTIKHLTGNVLNTIPFALPPLPEQYRIVTAIETIFTQLDEISESLS